TAAQNISRLVKAFSKVPDMAGCAWTVGFTKDAKVANFHLDHESLKLLMQQSPVYSPPGPVIDPPVPPKEDDPPMPEPPPPPPPPDTEPEPPKPPTDREYAEKLIALHQREAAALD